MIKGRPTFCILVLATLAVLGSLMLFRAHSGDLRKADLKRMDDTGYRSELKVVKQDEGPFPVGKRATISLKITNTGSLIWKDGEKHYIALGGFTQKPIDVLTNREGHGNDPQLRITPGINVKPGDSFFIDVGLENLPPGNYHHRYQMVREGDPPDGGWFGPIVDYRFQVR